MARKSYIGINNVAKNNKKIYVGIDDIARKVKKAYVGIDGVARVFYLSAFIEYRGTISSTSWRGTKAVSFEETAFFFGSHYPFNSQITIVDKSLSRTSASLKSARGYVGATNLDKYIIIAGGYSEESVIGNSWCNSHNDIEVYNTSSGTITNSYTELYPTGYGSNRIGATSVGDYAIFAGGNPYEMGLEGTNIYKYNVPFATAYNKSFTKTTLDNLASHRHSINAISLDSYAIFPGGTCETGSGDRASAIVDIYNSALTHSSFYLYINGYQAERSRLATAITGELVLMAGGHDFYLTSSSNKIYSDVFVLNKSLTISMGPSLSVASHQLTGVSINNHAVFLGDNFLNIYDKSLTKTVASPFKISRGTDYSAAIAGNYILVAGASSNIEVSIFNL